MAAPSPEPSVPRTRTLLVAIAGAAILSWAALFNGFPLVFPDSGTYLAIAFGQEYAIDRSSAYGLFLKPFVGTLHGVGGLWLALGAQMLAISAILFMAARQLDPRLRATSFLAALAAAAALTSLPWHAGQFMPDAFTAPLILLAWAAASRDPSESGAPLLWLVAAAVSLTHYTHFALLAATGAATILAQGLAGLPLRACGRRAVALIVASAVAAAAFAGSNALALGRASISPAGPLFLYARLNEDGLIPTWLDRHCGRDAPVALCSVNASLPRDSQKFLWGGADTPITSMIWHADDATRWRWIDAMALANRGAIAERPGAFLASAARGTGRQFASFAALDDECPVGCRSPLGGITYTLGRYRPETVAALHASRQVRDETGKTGVRAITTPVAILGLLLLPVGLLIARRRGDRAALSLIFAVGAGLFVNAALAGALSDVHDRYQSRVVWLAPFVLLLIAIKWRRGVPADT